MSEIQLTWPAPAFDREEPGEIARRSGAREDVVETAVDAEGDEQADGEEREQLDDRLEGDRRHHALVVLARVDMARAEQNREHRHDERHVQAGVVQDRASNPTAPASRSRDSCSSTEKLIEIALSCSEM